MKPQSFVSPNVCVQDDDFVGVSGFGVRRQAVFRTTPLYLADQKVVPPFGCSKRLVYNSLHLTKGLNNHDS